MKLSDSLVILLYMLCYTTVSFLSLCLGRHDLFHVRDTLLQDLLQHLRVLELALDLGHDRLGKFLLLALLHLPFVANPAVQDRLGFGGKGRLLLELEGLGF